LENEKIGRVWIDTLHHYDLYGRQSVNKIVKCPDKEENGVRVY
jgi:hypothetical protein